MENKKKIEEKSWVVRQFGGRLEERTKRMKVEELIQEQDRIEDGSQENKNIFEVKEEKDKIEEGLKEIENSLKETVGERRFGRK